MVAGGALLSARRRSSLSPSAGLERTRVSSSEGGQAGVTSISLYQLLPPPGATPPRTSHCPGPTVCALSERCHWSSVINNETRVQIVQESKVGSRNKGPFCSFVP